MGFGHDRTTKNRHIRVHTYPRSCGQVHKVDRSKTNKMFGLGHGSQFYPRHRTSLWSSSWYHHWQRLELQFSRVQAILLEHGHQSKFCLGSTSLIQWPGRASKWADFERKEAASYARTEGSSRSLGWRAPLRIVGIENNSKPVHSGNSLFPGVRFRSCPSEWPEAQRPSNNLVYWSRSWDSSAGRHWPLSRRKKLSPYTLSVLSTRSSTVPRASCPSSLLSRRRHGLACQTSIWSQTSPSMGRSLHCNPSFM